MESLTLLAHTAALVLERHREAEERKRVEEELLRRHAQFETLLNQAPLGVYLVDADCRIRQVNPTALSIFGDIPDVIGRDFDEVLHRWPKVLADEQIERFRNTLETGEPYVATEVNMKRQDSGVREYYEWRIDRIPLPDGRHGVVCYFRDISAQARAREAIAESEERFRTLADHMSQLAWMADDKGSIFWYNRRWFEYTGTTLEEMQGWGWKKVHHPEHVHRVVSRIQTSWDTGQTWEDTFPLRGKDGNYRWFLSRTLPIRDGQEKIIRWFGTNTDITERLAVEAQLREKQEQLVQSAKLASIGELATGVAHEINNPPVSASQPNCYPASSIPSSQQRTSAKAPALGFRSVTASSKSIRARLSWRAGRGRARRLS